jgi:hypothetical protein
MRERERERERESLFLGIFTFMWSVLLPSFFCVFEKLLIDFRKKICLCYEQPRFFLFLHFKGKAWKCRTIITSGSLSSL